MFVVCWVVHPSISYRLTHSRQEIGQRTRCTVPLYSMMGNKKRGRFSSMWTKKIALSLYADKNEGDIPLCGQKRGRFFSLRTKKRAIFLYAVRKEGVFYKRGPFPRAFLEEGQKRGLNVKYPPKTRAI